ncbi:MAG: hypothetical protein ACLFTL_09615, partial [Alphaproteobacteria bacterium]
APPREVETAITARRSIRRFLPDPAPPEGIEDILKVAAPAERRRQPALARLRRRRRGASARRSPWPPSAARSRRNFLFIDAGGVLLAGVAPGRLDPDAPENPLATERAPPAALTSWHDGRTGAHARPLTDPATGR